MEIVDTLKYSEDHEWVRIEGSRAIIGMTDFAQEELGIIVFIELPDVGDILQAGDPIGSLESIKTVSEMYVPLSGKVIEINRRLKENPGLINTSPYEGGWMLVMELARQEELELLWDADKYREIYGHE